MTKTLEQRIQHLEDQSAIQQLVATFANLADVKNVSGQMPLFTSEAKVETYFGDTLFAAMTGREEIEKVFSEFIKNFSIMYHMNGQMVLHINGDQAHATHYCLVVLVSGETDRMTKNVNGVVYEDEYVRQNGQWLIAKRVARFTWRDISDFVEPK